MARDMINENEARNLDEYERPEKLRQDRMKEALAAMTGDRTFAKLFDQTSQPSLSIGGQELDPALAARPEAAPLWTEAVAQGAGRLDPRAGDFIASQAARGVQSGQAESDAKMAERAAKIDKMLAEATLAEERAKYAGTTKKKAGEVEPQVRVLAGQLAAEAQRKYDEAVKAGKHWFSADEKPVMPGMTLTGPDMDYWTAVAQAALASGGTAPAVDPSTVIR
jgi:hypothetical protein